MAALQRTVEITARRRQVAKVTWKSFIIEGLWGKGWWPVGVWGSRSVDGVFRVLGDEGKAIGYQRVGPAASGSRLSSHLYAVARSPSTSRDESYPSLLRPLPTHLREQLLRGAVRSVRRQVTCIICLV